LFVPLLSYFVKENKLVVTCCPLFVSPLSFFVKEKRAYGSILSTVFPTTVHPAVIILDKIKNFRKVYMITIAVVAIPP
jgi:hypothetical protein